MEIFENYNLDNFAIEVKNKSNLDLDRRKEGIASEVSQGRQNKVLYDSELISDYKNYPNAPESTANGGGSNGLIKEENSKMNQNIPGNSDILEKLLTKSNDQDHPKEPILESTQMSFVSVPEIDNVPEKQVNTFWNRIDRKYYYKRAKYRDVYSGQQSKDGLKDGKGVLKTVNDKKIYEGFWKYGLKDGHGVLYNSNNRSMIYNGKWMNDLPNGFGKSYNVQEFIEYEGNFKDGLYHGKGKYFDFKGKLIYNGEFYNGYYQGFGELHNTTSCMIPIPGTYTGNFVEGIKEGYGTLITNG